VTKKERARRRVLIARRVRAARYPSPPPEEEQEADDQPPAEPPAGMDQVDVHALALDHVPDDVFESRARHGAEWVARHSGLVGDMA
jgi:hypothetical protein